MTLYEIGLEYEESAKLLRARLAELRRLTDEATDPEEVWRLKRRTQALTPMLTECNKLSKYCRRYYAQRTDRDNGGAFGERQLPRDAKAELCKMDKVGTHIDPKTHAKASRLCPGVSVQGATVHGFSARKRRKQEHYFSDILQGVGKTP